LKEKAEDYSLVGSDLNISAGEKGCGQSEWEIIDYQWAGVTGPKRMQAQLVGTGDKL